MAKGITTEDRQGTKMHVCDDCGRWCRENETMIRHARRCDTPDAQPVEAAAPAPAGKSAGQIKRLGREGSGLSADEVFDAAQRGQITMSDAMNRDD